MGVWYGHSRKLLAFLGGLQCQLQKEILFFFSAFKSTKITDNTVGMYFRPLWTAKDTFIHIFRHPGKWFKAGYCQGRQFGRVAHNGLHTSRMLFCMCVMMNFTMQKV